MVIYYNNPGKPIQSLYPAQVSYQCGPSGPICIQQIRVKKGGMSEVPRAQSFGGRSLTPLSPTPADVEVIQTSPHRE